MVRKWRVFMTLTKQDNPPFRCRPAGYEHEDLHTIMKRLKREIEHLKRIHRDWEQPAKRPKLDHDFKEITGHVYQYGAMIANVRSGLECKRQSWFLVYATSYFSMHLKEINNLTNVVSNSLEVWIHRTEKLHMFFWYWRSRHIKCFPIDLDWNRPTW